MPHEDGFHHPAIGDRIWDERRIRQSKQPNGQVWAIIEYGSDGLILVKWFAGDPRWQQNIEEELEEVEIASLDYRWVGTAYRIYAEESKLDERRPNAYGDNYEDF